MSQTLAAVLLARRRLVIGAIIVVVLLVAATSYEIFVHRAGAGQVTANLQVITGSAQVERSGSTAFTTATTGTQLGSGDSVRTNADSLAAIHYPDGSLTRLAGSSTVQVKTLAKTSAGGFDISLDQTAGKTWNEVKQLVNGSHFSVTAPNSSTAEVRGTTFSVVLSLVNGLPVVTVDVWDGSLTVSKNGANAVTVNTGQQAIITSTSSTPTVQAIPEADKQDPFTIYNKTADTTQGKAATIIGPGTINPGETTSLAQGATADGNTDLDFGLGWGGSSLELCVFGPDGTLYECLTSEAPPLHITIPDAEAGTWSFTVRAVVLAKPEAWYLIVGANNPTKIPVVPFISAPPGQAGGAKGKGCERDVTAGSTDTWTVKARSGSGKPTVTVDGITVADVWTKTKYGTFKNDKGDVTIKFAPEFGVDPATTTVVITATAKNGEKVTLKCTENILAPATSTISGTVKGVGEGVLLTLDDAYGHSDTTNTDQYGVYSFTPIRGGAYKLTMTVPSVCTLPFDAPPTTATPHVDGTNTATVDFALNCPGGSAIAPRISTAPLPDGTFGGRYSYRLSAFGGGLPQVWTKTSGLLPPGLVFDSTGAIHGTPDSLANSVDPTYSFTVIATGLNGLISAPRTLSITIQPAPQIVFSPKTTSPPTVPASGFILLPPPGEVTVPYLRSFGVVGGIAPYTWSVSSGDPSPWGLSLGSTGTTVNLSGTPTKSVVGGTIAVRVMDATGAIADGQVDMNIIRAPRYNHGASYRFDSTGFAEVDAGQSFYSNLGFGSSYPDGGKLSVSSGALPSCMNLSVSTGEGISYQMSGLLDPATCQGTFKFTIRLTDDGGGIVDSIPLTLLVNPPLGIKLLPPMGMVGVPYSWKITGTGGDPANTPIITISGTMLPLTSDGAAQPTISGTPTVAADFLLSVIVQDSVTLEYENIPATIHINGALVIVTSALAQADADQGIIYVGDTLVGAGGKLPYTWTLLSTNPSGLTLGAATGTLGGTITGVPGSYSVQVQLCDSSTPTPFCIDNASSPPYGFPLTVHAAPTLAASPTYPTPGWPGADTNVFYPSTNITLTGTGGFPDSCPSVTATGLPPGMYMIQTSSYCPSSWHPTGRPATSGTYTVSFSGTDGLGAITNTVTGTLVVTALTAPIINGTSGTTLATGAVGLRFPGYLSASGSAGNQFDPTTHSNRSYDWSTVPALPAGMSLNQSFTSVLLTGTPTAASPSTTYTLIITDKDGTTNTTPFTFTLQIEATYPNVVATPPGGDVGIAYSFGLTSSAGTAPFLFYPGYSSCYTCFSNQSFPPGLTLATNGTLSGTPTKAGTYHMTVRVVDNLGVSNQVSVVVAISNLPLTITSPSTAPHTGTAFSDGFTATGGTGPYTWTLVSGAPPAGLTFDKFGHITGTPTGAAGTTATFTVSVTDLAGSTTTATVTLTVLA